MSSTPGLCTFIRLKDLMGWPFFSQCSTGKGSPELLHRNLAVFPLERDTDSGGWTITGGAVQRRKWRTLKSCSSNPDCSFKEELKNPCYAHKRKSIIFPVHPLHSSLSKYHAYLFGTKMHFWKFPHLINALNYIRPLIPWRCWWGLSSVNQLSEISQDKTQHINGVTLLLPATRNSAAAKTNSLVLGLLARQT